MRILYFASVREAIGRDTEEIAMPVGLNSITDLLDHLSALDSLYAYAFADRARLRFAIDQKMALGNASLQGAEELAIFPPVTGG